MSDAILSERLSALGVPHAFGTRQAVPPPGLLRPQQVHGAVVVEADRVAAPGGLGEADAVVTAGDDPIGIVTADCVPVLVAAASGAVVAAIHGGWRGLAAGVVEAGIACLQRRAPGERLVAALGPSVGPCCYEVDEPVLAALEPRDPELRAVATRTARPGHAWLDLTLVATRALARAGVTDVDTTPYACTACNPTRFYSVRHEGPETGRLHHWIHPTT